jgi:hypothetical protein
MKINELKNEFEKVKKERKEKQLLNSMAARPPHVFISTVI